MEIWKVEIMDDQELIGLLADLESDRAERKESLSDPDKIRACICAFANDLPNHNQPGVLFIGARDDGSCARLPITDDLLLKLSDLRSDGSILPLPRLTVQKKNLKGCPLAVIIVHPSDSPPVRYKGRVYVHVGPSTRLASEEEERRLSEKRISKSLPFDLSPVTSASLNHLDLDFFTKTYLPATVPLDVITQNNRSLEQQLIALRFLNPAGVPTLLGVLTIGKDPREFIPGAYVQFLRMEGKEITDPIKDQKEIDGPLPGLLKELYETLEINIAVAVDLKAGAREIKHPDYPVASLRELAYNAILHRNYEKTNAPVRLSWFSDRVEIQNPGGPYGQVSKENFGKLGVTDYRNPHIAEVMKNLGYIQKFGIGIQLARKELDKNGNPELNFQAEDTHLLAIVRRRK